MKKLSLLLFLIGFNFVFAQVQTTETSSPQGSLGKDQKSYQSSEYPGGISKLRVDISEKINLKRLKGLKGRFYSQAKFSVNTEGGIENIVVTGENIDFNNEVERVIKSLKAKWKPAERNGILVSSQYTVPLNLTTE